MGAEPIEKYPALLTKAQLAQELQCSQRYIEKLQRARRIPVLRLTRGCVRYRRDAVFAALARLEVEAIVV